MSLVAIFTYYIISLPVACLLAFVAGLEIIGLWYGLYLGVTLSLVIHVVIVVRQDWQKRAVRAKMRM